MRIVRTNKGFTIVELLIVIVVIAILAAISVVAYNGIQERARLSRYQTELGAVNKAIQLYYVDNGRYSVCGGDSEWCGWDQAANFVPGISPKYMAKQPQLPESNVTEDTYLYMSGGTTYCLIRYRSEAAGGLSVIEKAGGLKVGTYADTAWGFESNETGCG